MLEEEDEKLQHYSSFRGNPHHESFESEIGKQLFLQDALGDFFEHFHAIDSKWHSISTNVKDDLLRKLQALQLEVTRNSLVKAILLDKYIAIKSDTFS